VLNLEQSFVWCWNLDTSESRSEMLGKFWNAVLHKDGDQLDGHVRNEEVSKRIKEESNILHKIKRRKVNWVGHILRRNCLLKHVTEW